MANKSVYARGGSQNVLAQTALSTNKAVLAKSYMYNKFENLPSNLLNKSNNTQRTPSRTRIFSRSNNGLRQQNNNYRMTNENVKLERLSESGSTKQYDPIIIKESSEIEKKHDSVKTPAPTELVTIEKVKLPSTNNASQQLTPEDKVCDWLSGHCHKVTTSPVIPQVNLIKPFGFRKPKTVAAPVCEEVPTVRVPEFRPGKSYYKLLERLEKSAEKKKNQQRLIREREEQLSLQQ